MNAGQSYKITYKTYKAGSLIEVSEHDGMHTKEIHKILWRERGMNGKGEWYEKDEVLIGAAEWCIFLYYDNTWSENVPYGATIKRH